MTNDEADIAVELRLTIQALLAEHAWRLDHGASDTLYQLYTTDGELLNLPPRDLIGRQAIRDWGDERVKLKRVSRHVETNQRIYHDGDRLCGTSYASVYRSDSGDTSLTAPFMVGDYEDVYAIENGRWLIRRRVIRAAFRAVR